MTQIAIHGFGRIGRSALKMALKRGLFVPVSISNIRDLSTLGALFEVDTNYGHWHEEVRATSDTEIVIGGRKIKYLNTEHSLPDWGQLGVELVIDCTGRATTRAGGQEHLDYGAKRVWSARPVRPWKMRMRCSCLGSISSNSIPASIRS